MKSWLTITIDSREPHTSSCDVNRIHMLPTKVEFRGDDRDLSKVRDHLTDYLINNLLNEVDFKPVIEVRINNEDTSVFK